MKKISPYLKIICSFIITIFIGAILLTLPISSKNSNFLESLFTAASALCVTGLVVNDIGATYTLFGQTVILILIQLGGLGLLTFSSMILIFLSNKMNYYDRRLAGEETNFNILEEIPRYLKKVFLIVIIIELIGAFFLFFQFIKEYKLLKAIYYSIFHSVSAFCNAGFSLYKNNLEIYNSNILINVVISCLIIIGGIGFYTIMDIINTIRKKRQKLSNSSYLSIKISIILIILGSILTYILEYNNINTIANFSQKDKIMSSIFQSVTMRTAGFNTFGLSHIRVSTALVYIVLMFIGASSGSTGGGIKTTTFAVIILGIYTSLMGREDIEYRKKSISWNMFNKACAVVFSSIIYISICLFILSIFDEKFSLLELMIEIVSAFGTVGVSMGITANLSVISKIIIIITMFIGRVGPLTIMLAISKRKIKEGIYKYPKENILIG